MLNGLLRLIAPKNTEQQRADAHRMMLREFAKIGGGVFGPVPKGTRREFFCLDEHTWIWHEEWVDAHKQHHVRTTRYDIRPQGVYKAQDGQPYRPLNKDEAVNLYYAIDAYNRAVAGFIAPRLATA